MRVLYRNGRVWTMDPARPEAEAFLVEGDRIRAVGADYDFHSALAAGDKVIDLGGRTVVPGLIDAHVHFSWFSFNLLDVNLEQAATLDEALALVRDRAARTPAGGWVRGQGFNANRWDRWPTRQDLDQIAPDHRVVLTSKDCHSLWVNSLVMQDAGVTPTTADPPGGKLLRDLHGVPTGIFQEHAAEIIRAILPQRDHEEYKEALRRGLRYAAQMGVTGVHCMDGIDCFRAFRSLEAGGELTLRVLKQIPESKLDVAVEAGLATGFGNEWLRVGCLKVFSDGSLGSQTAFLLNGYETAPDYRGVPTHTPESLRTTFRKAVENDFALAVHAIGDAANRMVLDAFLEVADRSWQKGLRHRIEHAQLLTEEDLTRFAALGVIASVQPSHAPSDRYVADVQWGERCRLAYAFRSLRQHGARLALGSDVPVEPLDPLAGIHAAVWRKRLDEPDSAPWYPEQQLTVAEAVHGFTMGAAYASGEEQLKGSLSPGKLADFVVLSHDIRSGDEVLLKSVRPEVTVVGGRQVFGEL